MFELKDNLPELASGDLFYDIKEGYIKPVDFLKNKEDVVIVNNALATMEEFIESIDGVVEEM
jgi:hypothetical protein